MTGTAVITTTINYPVETFTKISKVAKLIVAGDLKTPPDTGDLVRRLGGVYLEPGAQDHWECSDIIGWNSIQRRNIAFLEAYRLGYSTIISVDDDNCPEDPDLWLRTHEAAMDTVPSRLFSTKNGWYNPGSQLEPLVVARGMPYDVDDRNAMNARIPHRVPNDVTLPIVGVNAGLWLGDPDIDAMQRIVRAPLVDRLSVNVPIAVRPGTYAPINSQNTAWRREMLPLAAVIPGVGRWDDIFGGYTAQWSFWAQNAVVQYGPPVVQQVRNDHDLFVDLGNEISGYLNTVPWIEMLKSMTPTGDPLKDLAQVADRLHRESNQDRWERVWMFISAWIRDWENMS